jgi:hypothetical protein
MIYLLMLKANAGLRKIFCVKENFVKERRKKLDCSNMKNVKNNMDFNKNNLPY